MSAKQLTLDHEILPPRLAIKAMRSSGYRDSAHAVAELIDNSIQAGIGVNKTTQVEVLCVDQVQVVQERRRQQIHRIAVYDNASGMDSATLRMALQFGNGTHLGVDDQKGIGKFGMGLPNASISQCRHVDVWSWRKGKCLYTYLDIDEIEGGKLREVPEPTAAKIPEEWRGLVRDTIGEHGTLVVWSELDRVRWKTSTAFLRNAEFLVGRIYRYFIQDGSAVIRLAAFEQTGREVAERLDSDVRPNDPLFLSADTCAPSPYDKQAAFDEFTEHSMGIVLNGKEHPVRLHFSIVKPEVRVLGGHHAIGKMALKNQGVSVVRARRELEVNESFDNTYDPRERWWGVEVQFDPELDEVFGVTNTKQAATAFRKMNLEADAEAEGLTPGRYRELLQETQDPRLAIYEVSERIEATLRTIRAQIARMREGTRAAEDVVGPGSAEDIATRATRQRRQRLGVTGASDTDELRPPSERRDELADELVADGVAESEAKQIAVEYVQKNLKYLFQEAPVPGPVVFDVKSRAGTIIVLINTEHPAREHLFELLKQTGTEVDSPALKALKLLLTAWARLEDEAGDQRRQQLQDTRLDWGRIARDFLQEADA